MPSLKSILVSPSKKRKDKAREERKRSISGPLEIGVSREEAVGLVSPRDAPSTPNSPPGLPPITTALNDGSPSLGVARLTRVTTAPALTGSPRPRHGKEVERESEERQVVYSPPPKKGRSQSQPQVGTAELDSNEFTREELRRQAALELSIAMHARRARLDMARQDHVLDAHRASRGWGEDQEIFYTPEEEQDVLWSQGSDAALEQEQELARQSEKAARQSDAAHKMVDEARRLERHFRRVERSSDRASSSNSSKALTERLGRLSMSTIREGGTDSSRAPSRRASSEFTDFTDVSPVTPRSTAPPGEEWQRLPEEHRRAFQDSHPLRFQGSSITYPKVPALTSGSEGDRKSKADEGAKRK